MLLQIHLPNHDEALAFNRQLWADVHADATLSANLNRIETNAWGQIIMTPPADGSHCVKQFRIALQLQRLMNGSALTECPISTVDGVRAADAAWFSDDRYARVRGQSVFEIAPEICVEVLSPRNTAAEMKSNRDLYFSAGAIECWTCDLNGQMSYYDRDQPDTPLDRSKLCPNFPSHIVD